MLELRAGSVVIGLTLAVWLGAVRPSPAEDLPRLETDASGRIVFTNVVPGSQAVAGSGVMVARTTSGVGEAARHARRLSVRPHVTAAATRYGLSPRLVEAVIEVESDFKPRALSRKGAQGLMQLMPDTARALGVTDPWDPAANIDAGSRFLRQLLDQFDQDRTLALAAYHAGPNAVVRAGGVPANGVTRDYVRKVLAITDRGTASSAGPLRAVRIGGRIHLSNVGHTDSSLRLVRSRHGRLTLTNR